MDATHRTRRGTCYKHKNRRILTGWVQKAIPQNTGDSSMLYNGHIKSVFRWTTCLTGRTSSWNFARTPNRIKANASLVRSLSRHTDNAIWGRTRTQTRCTSSWKTHRRRRWMCLISSRFYCSFFECLGGRWFGFAVWHRLIENVNAFESAEEFWRYGELKTFLRALASPFAVVWCQSMRLNEHP